MATENETTPQSKTGNNNSGGYLKIKATGSWIVKNSDAILKLVGSIAIIFGTLLVAKYESRMSAIALITQREQAESDLRSDMFNNLIAPVSGPYKNNEEIDTHRECVLVELLALNFHEHFEFKPLMIHVDNRLREKYEDEKSDEKEKEEAKSDRKALHSIARRVVDRQIAILLKEDAHEPVTLEIEVDYENSVKTDNDLVEEDFNDNELLKGLIRNEIIMRTAKGTFIFCDTIEDESQLSEKLENLEILKNSGFNVKKEIIELWRKPQVTITPKHNEKFIKTRRKQYVSLKPPDSKGATTLTVMLDWVDWKNKTVNIEFLINKLDNMSETGDLLIDPQTFTLTLYDFPLTDNTLLPDENRFALVLDNVEVERGTVTLKIIWFPKGYFTARERPIKHVEFRNKLGI